MPGLTLRPEDIRALEDYSWPGNVRELHNVIERSVLLSSTGRLNLSLSAGSKRARPAQQDSLSASFDSEPQRLARMKQDLLRALEQAEGRVSGPNGAAALLQVKPTTLASRMKRFGIQRRFS